MRRPLSPTTALAWLLAAVSTIMLLTVVATLHYQRRVRLEAADRRSAREFVDAGRAGATGDIADVERVRDALLAKSSQWSASAPEGRPKTVAAARKAARVTRDRALALARSMKDVLPVGETVELLRTAQQIDEALPNAEQLPATAWLDAGRLAGPGVYAALRAAANTSDASARATALDLASRLSDVTMGSLPDSIALLRARLGDRVVSLPAVAALAPTGPLAGVSQAGSDGRRAWAGELAARLSAPAGTATWAAGPAADTLVIRGHAIDEVGAWAQEYSLLRDAARFGFRAAAIVAEDGEVRRALSPSR